MEKQLDINIGGEEFQIFIEKRYLPALEKELRDYLVGTVTDGCIIKVTPYLQHERFFWNQSDLERFRIFFLNIHLRFPSNDPLNESV